MLTPTIAEFEMATHVPHVSHFPIYQSKAYNICINFEGSKESQYGILLGFICLNYMHFHWLIFKLEKQISSYIFKLTSSGPALLLILLGFALAIKKINVEETSTFLDTLIFQYMSNIKDFMMIFKVALLTIAKNKEKWPKCSSVEMCFTMEYLLWAKKGTNYWYTWQHG